MCSGRTPMSHANTDKETEVTITLAKYEEYLRLQTALIYASSLIESLESAGELKSFPKSLAKYKEVFAKTDLSKWLAEIDAVANDQGK